MQNLNDFLTSLYKTKRDRLTFVHSIAFHFHWVFDRLPIGKTQRLQTMMKEIHIERMEKESSKLFELPEFICIFFL